MIKMIEKRSGTYADALEAIGWATLLSELELEGVTIRDQAWRFVIEGKGEPMVAQCPGLGYWFVSDDKNPAPPVADWTLDYEKERTKAAEQREYEKATKTTKKKKSAIAQAAEREDLAISDPPKPELKLALMISWMRKGWNADRELAVWIDEHPDECREWVTAALAGKTYAKRPKLSNSQLLNPTSGKGVSAAKTEDKSANSLPGILVDPFAEWMKLRGLWQGMIAYRNGDDFKFMVLEPGHLTPDGVRVARSKLEALNLWGGVRLDIEAILRLSRILIQNSDVVQKDAPFSLKGRRPRHVIRGLRQAYFKSLGRAAALMNDALLPLPEWFALEGPEDVEAYYRIIDEAIGDKPRGGCLGVLDEDKSDEGAVLQQYRTWLGTGDFEELMDFYGEFGALMLRKAAAGEDTRLFTTEVLDELLIRTYEGTEMLTHIIENEGFKSVARAIRNTTIYAVGLKNKKREIQFGLAQRWRQNIKQGGGEFVVGLAEFVQANNWEVVHRLEGRGHQVSTSHLDHIFELIEAHGEEKVGALLLAYGFSRAPKTEGEPQELDEAAA